MSTKKQRRREKQEGAKQRRLGMWAFRRTALFGLLAVALVFLALLVVQLMA